MSKKDIPFSPPDITEEEIQAVTDALKSGWITTGPQTKQFEREIAEFCHTKRGVTMNSATACMEMTLRLLGVGPGDEVITSAYTYTASASVIDHVGAKIVMVDTAKDSYEMDYDQLAEAITEKTKAIIPVDIAGVMCDYDRIVEVLESRKALYHPTEHTLQEAFDRVVIIADAAHSYGASNRGRMSGEVADFTCFSFHAVKNLTTGEGGAVVWKDIPGVDPEDIYKKYMLLILHGQNKDALAKTQVGGWEYDIVAPYFKCNMTDIVASLGRVQQKRYAKLLEHRRAIIERYDRQLRAVGIRTMDHLSDDHASSGHLYITRVPGIGEDTRNQIIIDLGEQGITTNVHYKPLPMMTAYKNLGFDIKDYPNAFDMYQNAITLPLHTGLSNEDVDYICEKYIELVEEL